MEKFSANHEYDKLYRQKKALQHALAKTPSDKQFGIRGKIKQIDKKLFELQKRIDKTEFEAR